MIGTVTAMSPAVTSGAAAAYNPATPANSRTHIPETNVEVTTNALPEHPTVNEYTRRPVAGFRAIVNGLVRTGIPRLPKGPSQVPFMGPGFKRAGAQPLPVNKVQQYVPVPTLETAPDWTDYLR